MLLRAVSTSRSPVHSCGKDVPLNRRIVSRPDDCVSSCGSTC
jgi:hypothetical protein